jgi:hypothetical protein
MLVGSQIIQSIIDDVPIKIQTSIDSGLPLAID